MTPFLPNPTALIVDEAHLFTAAPQFLARRRLMVPEQVSLVCTDFDSTFAPCKPSVAHIRWDSGPVIRRVVRWADTRFPETASIIVKLLQSVLQLLTDEGSDCHSTCAVIGVCGHRFCDPRNSRSIPSPWWTRGRSSR